MKKLFFVLLFLFLVGCQKEEFYTVEFLVDGNVVDTQEVLKGNDAILPNNPVKEGYEFIGWDKEYTNVENNLKVNANFLE